MPTKPHFVVDPDFPTSREVLSIPRRHRAAAVGVWTLCGAWSANKMTDGRVPSNALREMLVTPNLCAVLIKAGLWEAVEDETVGVRSGVDRTTVGLPSGGIQFCNWVKWQKTRAQWQKGRQSNADRQAEYRERRQAAQAAEESRTSNALPHAVNSGGSNVVPMVRNALVTRQSSKEEKRESSGGLVQSGGPQNQPPPPTPLIGCVKHPGGTSEPCADCRRVRLQTGADADHAAITNAAARQLELTRKSRCTACDPNGLRYADPTDWDSPLIRCDHPDIP